MHVGMHSNFGGREVGDILSSIARGWGKGSYGVEPPFALSSALSAHSLLIKRMGNN